MCVYTPAAQTRAVLGSATRHRCLRTDGDCHGSPCNPAASPRLPPPPVHFSTTYVLCALGSRSISISLAPTTIELTSRRNVIGGDGKRWRQV